jgi:hypothetical protein
MTDTTDDDDDQIVLDMKAAEADADAGAKAYQSLIDTKTEDFTRWTITIKGLRALCTIAYAEAQTTNKRSQAFRNAMGALLQKRRWAALAHIDRQTRSTCYRLMDRIEDVARWYATEVSSEDQMRWKHPDAIAKHCPTQYLSSGEGHNKPPRKPAKKKKKPATSAETERLKALLLRLIHLVINSKDLVKIKREAAKLLDQVMTPEDPNDDLPDDLQREAPDDYGGA